MPDLGAPTLGGADLHHLQRALRLRPGELVGASDGEGGWRLCRFAGAGELDAEGPLEVEAAPRPRVTVGLAVPKGERADWAVQKLTEVGVDRIVPLVADRGVVRPDAERTGRLLARWGAVARSAAMQSRRLWLPEIGEPESVVGMLAGTGGSARHGASPAPAPVVALAEAGGAPPDLDRPTILVGPEGGWSDAERSGATALVGLGPTVLRTETAAVVAGSLLVALRSGVVAPVVVGARLA
ncbi:MAG: 16S rRNA (uracil(1498)-N(3))-methyltransferase [Actinomycetota bacterium]|nr:16S rRNA (uracil(1498)-N(3))-methyltransferase [Actinomycetota bacterium]